MSGLWGHEVQICQGRVLSEAEKAETDVQLLAWPKGKLDQAYSALSIVLSFKKWKGLGAHQ